jgi:hypothetical protein
MQNVQTEIKDSIQLLVENSKDKPFNLLKPQANRITSQNTKAKKFSLLVLIAIINEDQELLSLLNLSNELILLNNFI